MATHIANEKQTVTIPLWAVGLSEFQISAVRLEAVKRGITPAELVREWVMELAEKLLKPAA